MHTTATPHHTDHAWQLECTCGTVTEWHALLGAAVAQHTDHANNHARNKP